MRYTVFLVLALLFYADAVTALPACSDSEATIWSCKNSDVTYAVCAAADLTLASGYMQFRVIKDGQKVLVAPEPHRHPADLFEFFILGREARLIFEDAGTRYLMREDVAGPVTLTVSKSGEFSNTVQCTESDYALTLTDTLNRLRAAGIID